MAPIMPGLTVTVSGCPAGNDSTSPATRNQKTLTTGQRSAPSYLDNGLVDVATRTIAAVVVRPSTKSVDA